MTLEEGRFNPLKTVPAAIKSGQTFEALTSREFREYLDSHNMRENLMELMTLAREGNSEEAIGLAQELIEEAEMMLQAAPKTNPIVSQWVGNVTALLQESLQVIVDAIRDGNEVDLQYVVDELSGAEMPESEFYSLQVSELRNIDCAA